MNKYILYYKFKATTLLGCETIKKKMLFYRFDLQKAIIDAYARSIKNNLAGFYIYKVESYTSGSETAKQKVLKLKKGEKMVYVFELAGQLIGLGNENFVEKLKLKYLKAGRESSEIEVFKACFEDGDIVRLDLPRGEK